MVHKIVIIFTIIKIKEFIDDNSTITFKQIESHLEELVVDNDQKMLIGEILFSMILQNYII